MINSKIVTWDDEISIKPKSCTEISNKQANFSIILHINTIENAFRHVLNIDKEINGIQSSVTENDFKDFEKYKEIDCIFGTNGYKAKYEPEKSKLRFVFVEGGLE